MKKIVFPKNFYWGSSASAHQVEGNNIHSDWWSWEQKGNVKNKEVSGKACNFWYLYQQDLDLAKKN